MKNIYLNFGAGNPVKYWHNLDSSPFFATPAIIHKILVKLNLSKRSKKYIMGNYSYYKFSTNSLLPFTNNSVNAIYTSHVQEHLSIEENKHFFKEAYRILKSKGVLRVIVPDLENKIDLSKGIFSLEYDLLTLPKELKTNKFRAIMEAAHGFPSFHKSLFVKKNLRKYFSKKWSMNLNLNYLESKIDKNRLYLVEQKSRTKNALVFELIKK